MGEVDRIGVYCLLISRFLLNPYIGKYHVLTITDFFHSVIYQ